MKLYIASRAPETGIYLCELLEDGELTALSLERADHPAWLCRDGETLYALLREPFQLMSGMNTYRIGKDGDLSLTGGPYSTHGLYSAHLYAEKGTVWCANYIDGTVLRFPDRLKAFQGAGPDRLRQLSSHPHCITPTPDGKYLCVNDLGTDRIYLLTHELEQVSEAVMPEGCGPRHLVFSPNGKTAFSSNEMGSSVSVLTYDAGILQYVCSCSTVPEDYSGENSASAVRISSAGDTLYVSNRGHNSVAVFDISGNELRRKGFIPCFGNSPRDIALAGEHLLCANELSDSVTVFSLKNGLPESPVSEFSVKMPWCILPLEGDL